MTSLQQSFNGNFLTRHFSRRMMEVLPRRFKRLLYVSSVMGLILKQIPETSLVDKINQKLHLAYGAVGMLFPIYIGSIIWRSLINNVIRLDSGLVSVDNLNPKELSEIDCWRTGLFFARNTPMWLQYGSDDLMAADIHDMLMLLEDAA